MRPRSTPYLLLVAAVLVAATLLFAAACGEGATTTTSASSTTVSTGGETATTGGSTGGSAGATVKGMVDNPLALTAAELQKLNVVTLTAEHPKFGPTEYTGVRMSDLFATLGVQDAATTLVMAAPDGFMAEVPLADIKASADAMIAIAEDGKLNAVIPGLDGKAWVRDIVSMEFK